MLLIVFISFFFFASFLGAFLVRPFLVARHLKFFLILGIFVKDIRYGVLLGVGRENHMSILGLGRHRWRTWNGMGIRVMGMGIGMGMSMSIGTSICMCMCMDMVMHGLASPTASASGLLIGGGWDGTMDGMVQRTPEWERVACLRRCRHIIT
ncbi:hypothetical protein K505DRAFT_148385 [Melanomma pulvis-pyrius CBS 109.77]|uniref:Uncharacterized protein n=1 Tax=Melanomma pulvis-pyrius CBS 109.77 TaxID=1314802 RepID=A0A6A6XKY0_9PLEO|nr:hypothetical protein K505DRAFT_148385 [Melanomma pulvis-pyrius CBS 109.77]